MVTMAVNIISVVSRRVLEKHYGFFFKEQNLRREFHYVVETPTTNLSVGKYYLG